MYRLLSAMKRLFPLIPLIAEQLNLAVVNEKMEDIFADFLTGVKVQPKEGCSEAERLAAIALVKKRGRKPKSWYDEQERLKKEKQLRKD